MAPGQPIAAAEIRSAVNAAIHRHWGLFLFEGIVLIVLGTLRSWYRQWPHWPPQSSSDGSCC